MSRIYSHYLADIVECCERIQNYSAGLTFKDFESDQKTVDAVARNLEIIGEAAKNAPDEILARKADIDWRNVRRFRDKIAHHYFDINLERVWVIVETKLFDLKSAARELLGRQLKIDDLE